MAPARKYDVDKFIRLKKTDNTREGYRVALADFARYKFADKIRELDPSEQREKAIALLNAYILKKDVDPVADIRGYIESRNGKARSTTNVYSFAVRQFYIINGHQFNKQELAAVKPKTVTAETRDEPITLDILKKMVDAGDLHNKLLITLLISTGCRIGELVQVRIKDLDLASDPARIRLPDHITKTGKGRVVFLTPEARGLVINWLDGARDRYMELAEFKNKGLVAIGKCGQRPDRATDDRLLGCSYDTARFMFMKMLERSVKGMRRDDLTRRHLIHLHSCRKYFRTHAVKSMSLDSVEQIMGHQGYLSGSYVRLTEEELAAAFKKGCYVLSITEGHETRAIRERQDHQSERILSLERERERLEGQIADITKSMDREKQLVGEVESDPIFIAMKKAAEAAAMEEYRKRAKRL
jgi:integrase